MRSSSIQHNPDLHEPVSGSGEQVAAGKHLRGEEVVEALVKVRMLKAMLRHKGK